MIAAAAAAFCRELYHIPGIVLSTLEYLKPTL